MSDPSAFFRGVAPTFVDQQRHKREKWKFSSQAEQKNVYSKMNLAVPINQFLVEKAFVTLSVFCIV